MKSHLGRVSKYGSKFSFEMPTVAAVLQCLIDSLRSKGGGGLVELFESAANNNTREMLELVRRFLTSKFLDSIDIADNYRSDASYRIRVFHPVRTLMLGDSVHYDPNSSPFCNLFDVQRSNSLEHFTRLTALSFLLSLANTQTQQVFARVSDVTSHICKVGYTAAHASCTIQYLFERRCIESRDPVELCSNDAQEVCISQLGRYHVTHIVAFFPYLDPVSVDTTIMDSDAYADIRDV